MAHFIITHDQLESRDVRIVVGAAHPERAKLEESSLAALKAMPGAEFFRIKDDDGEVYWLGYYFGDVNSQDAFAPLDWAGGDGCTSIEYQAHNFDPL